MNDNINLSPEVMIVDALILDVAKCETKKHLFGIVISLVKTAHKLTKEKNSSTGVNVCLAFVLSFLSVNAHSGSNDIDIICAAWTSELERWRYELIKRLNEHKLAEKKEHASHVQM